MNAKSTLTQWLADGDLDRTLRGLEWLQRQHLSTLQPDLVLVKGRFQSLQTERDRGTVSEEQLRIEQARIRMAAQNLIEYLPDNWPSAGLEQVQSGAGVAPTPSKSRRSSGTFWGLVIAAAGLLIALLSYLNDRGIFPPKEPTPVEQPAQGAQQPAEKPAETPPPAPSKATPAPKKQTNVTVKDSAEVGILNTGDNPVFNIKK
jgi:hypothetical protein